MYNVRRQLSAPRAGTGESENKQEDSDQAAVSGGCTATGDIQREKGQHKKGSRTSLTICNSCKNQAIIAEETDTRQV